LAGISCELCQGGDRAHVHCMICCLPIKDAFSKKGSAAKTCSEGCHRELCNRRRAARMVRVWASLEPNGDKIRVWMPRTAFRKALAKGLSTTGQGVGHKPTAADSHPEAKAAQIAP
jgi:hypothetical protein